MSNIAISVNNISKTFKVFLDGSKSIKEILTTSGRRKYEKRKVLDGISFQVKKGEAIGLIGKNGCGKSTTLKMLARIIYPDSGSIEIKGRVSSLLELGAGFHPDMSGRENIYLNASIFGLTRKEIDEKLDDIISFSELEDFIDNPVRTYSSGMYMRLAFSVAINVEADILLIDEILAVGDVSFQAKCFEKLKDIRRKGTTIIIVSHSLGQIEQICDKSIWIEDGRVVEEGIPKFVHEHYMAKMENERLDRISKSLISSNSNKASKEINANCETWAEGLSRSGNRDIEFIRVELRDSYGRQRVVFETGEDIIVYMQYKANKDMVEGNFGVGINRDDGVYCYGTNTLIETGKMQKVSGIGEMTMVIESNKLLQAKYILDVAIHTVDDIPIDRIHHILEFQVKSNLKHDFGVCRLDNFWIKNGERI